jgi:hypothetical protein
MGSCPFRVGSDLFIRKCVRHWESSPPDLNSP